MHTSVFYEDIKKLEKKGYVTKNFGNNEEGAIEFHKKHNEIGILSRFFRVGGKTRWDYECYVCYKKGDN